jgi:hypothetical protein
MSERRFYGKEFHYGFNPRIDWVNL